MKRLERLELYGAGLVHIGSPTLVERYNKTLGELGLPPTELEEFHVDGMGWSPEIADEQGERYYLSHGMANPLAIVITPDQRKKPIYAPFASYNRRLMEGYFDAFMPEIVDITRSTALWLDLDQQLSRFNKPRDLLLVPYVTVRSHAGPLTEAAAQQRDLVERYLKNPLAWFDGQLRGRMITSAQVHGDLRFRRLAIPDQRFHDVRCFYTGLFGGTFVLRDLDRNGHLLIMTDEKEFLRRDDLSDETWHISDANLIDRLSDERLVDINIDWYREHLDVVRDKLEGLAANIICQTDPEVDFGRLPLPQRKQRIQALDEDLVEPFFELERWIARLESQDMSKGDLSPRLRLLLLHPHDRLEAGSTARDLMWQLISRLSPLDVLRLYTSDKEAFFAAYQTWPESKKRWAANRIANQYRHKTGD